jgi:hypothetical protein
VEGLVGDEFKVQGWELEHRIFSREERKGTQCGVAKRDRKARNWTRIEELINGVFDRMDKMDGIGNLS